MSILYPMGGEATMSYFTRMLGLTIRNFLSAVTGNRRRLRPDPRLRAALNANHRPLLGGYLSHHSLPAVTPVNYAVGRVFPLDRCARHGLRAPILAEVTL